MLDFETTMERAFREEGALLAMADAYRKGKVLNATEKDAEDFFKRAVDELNRIHKVINSPDAAHISGTQKKAA